jgi:endonuclease/exonuclease/phosphatase (EEP) superfamily protein YafD
LDTSRGVLFGATWSYYLPYRLLIDHAFVSDEWLLRRREVGPALGSDHRPLIVDLARFR